MRYIILITFIAISVPSFSQNDLDKKMVSKDSLYNANIKKSKLYGVYIPRDVDDALNKLMELTDEDARKKLTKITEEEAARKLHYGIGRWMSYNWNFDEGSRFSHYLREKGLYYSEDMMRYMIILFHRKISKKTLNEVELMNQLIERRNKIMEEERKTREVIISEEVIRKQ